MMAQISFGGLPWILLLQSTASLAAGLVGSYLFRSRAARAHRVLLACMAAAILAPAGFALARHHGWGLLEPPAAVETSVLSDPVDYPAFDVLPTEPILIADSTIEIPETPIANVTLSAPVEQTPRREIPWTSIVLGSWAALSALLLGRLLLRLALGARLIRQAQTVRAIWLREALHTTMDRLGLGGDVELRSSRKVRSPVIWCWRRVPVLLVHENASTAEKCDWTGVFCHELAHWKRLDHVSGLLAEMLTATLPWHPLTWWAKSRLSRLSEDACDDWVIAGGHTTVDYAESLLDLTPQGQPAFLPTVVGKERTMKARIYRIVSDKCGNPVVGTRWALGLVVLVMCVAAGVALAQPAAGPREPRATGRPVRSPDLVAEGQRNALERMLRLLQSEAENTEVALAEQGNQPGERGQVLRAELNTLRNQIERIERQLAEADLPRPEPGPVVAATRAAPRIAGTRAVTPRSRPTAPTDSPASPVAPTWGRTTTGWTVAPRAGTTTATRGTTATDPRLAELRNQARVMRDVLNGLDDPQGPRAEALRDALAETEQEIHQIEVDKIWQQDEAMEARDQARRQLMEDTISALNNQQQPVQSRATVTRRRGRVASSDDRRVSELRQMQMDLEMEIAEAEQQLARTGDADSPEVAMQRTRVKSLLAERQEIDRQINDMLSRNVQRPVVRTAPARGSAGVRQAELQQRRASLQAQVEEIQNRLAVLDVVDGSEAEELRLQLGARRQQMQDVDRQMAQLSANTQRPANRPLETEVEELRGQIHTLNEQLQQMQNMLEQLVTAQQREAVQQR